jgi:hypothetical protein
MIFSKERYTLFKEDFPISIVDGIWRLDIMRPE